LFIAQRTALGLPRWGACGVLLYADAKNHIWDCTAPCLLGARKPNVSGESSISLNDAIAAGSF
jgi:hypothetical protein